MCSIWLTATAVQSAGCQRPKTRGAEAHVTSADGLPSLQRHATRRCTRRDGKRQGDKRTIGSVRRAAISRRRRPAQGRRRGIRFPCRPCAGGRMAKQVGLLRPADGRQDETAGQQSANQALAAAAVSTTSVDREDELWRWARAARRLAADHGLMGAGQAIMAPARHGGLATRARPETLRATPAARRTMADDGTGPGQARAQNSGRRAVEDAP